MNSDVSLSLRLALRAQFGTIALVLVLAVMLMALLAGLFSARQPATVTLDVGISLMRLALPLLIILMIQELISKEFEHRYYLVSLTYPRLRETWLLSRVMMVFLLGIGTLLVMAIALALLVMLVGAGYTQTTEVDLGLAYWITLGMMSVDLFTITAIATMLAVMARTTSFILIGSIGFMLIARSYASVIGLLSENVDPILSKVVDQESYTQSLSILRFLLPDLAALDVRYISLYGQMEFLPVDWVWSVVGTLAYAIVLLSLATWWISRRRLG